jgi:RNA-binding motif protein, X-linked 2
MRECKYILEFFQNVEEMNELMMHLNRTPEGSWHADYRDTAYIYIGGLPFDLSEGDIITIFSQFGEPTHVDLIRDKDTGKSKGFAFLKYEDQRSCDLAVDNLGGASIMGRVLKVDHTRTYKKKDGERDGEDSIPGQIDDELIREGNRRKRRRTAESESEEEVPLLKEERELMKLMQDHDEDDPMKNYLIEEKKEELEKAKERARKVKGRSRTKEDKSKSRHRHHHRSRRDEDDRGSDRKSEQKRAHRHRSHSREKTKTKDGDSPSVERHYRSRSREKGRERGPSPSYGSREKPRHERR